MKLKLLVLNALLLTGVAYTSLGSESFNQVKVSAISSYGDTTTTYTTSLATTIDLNDNTDAEIKEYYSSLSGLDSSELQGTNLLKNLREIIHDMTYYSYSNIWKIYEITDRDWDLSPASETTYGTYNEETNKITGYSYSSSNSDTKNNPYVHAMYRNVGEEDGYIKAWGDHNSSGINREHVWCNSQGFSDTYNNGNGPAYNDLHHLIAADGQVNQTIHNAYPYGNVDLTQSYAEGNKTYTEGNYRGISTFDGKSTVFEPQDSDKGDIARAIFYMAACYNNYSGEETITDEDPYLALANYATGSTDVKCSSSSPAYMGILQDLLQWNKEDPVDEYEIHRNNLIYNNYQYNRNPFIDYPEWADYIWGTVDEYGNYNSTPTGYVDLDNDVINEGAGLNLSSSIEIGVGETYSLVATTTDDSDISWSIDDTSVATISDTTTASGEALIVTGVSNGTAVITATATVEGEELTRDCTVTVGEVATDDTDDGDIYAGLELDSQQLLIIGIIALVVLIIVIIIIVVISKNKKAKKKAKSAAKKATKKAVKNAKNKK